MIITGLKLTNWKNFLDINVKFLERNFIIGPNASGKSNLLDALRFLRDISKQSGGLQGAVDQRGGITKIRCLSARKKSNIIIEISLGEPGEDEPMWIYHLNIKQTGGGIQKKEAKVISEKVWSKSYNNWILNRDENSTDEDNETLKYTHLEQVTANKEFREIQTFLQNIEYLNVVPQLVRESSSYTFSKSREDYFGRNFLERISTLNERTRNSFLKRINDVLKLAVPQLQELNFIKDEKGIPHLEARYKHWRAYGSKQEEEQFSDGTLRLIGFFWALLDSKGTILLEEPELNLHSTIIKQLPEAIAKVQRNKKNLKQVIITTHSYDLLNNDSIGPDEVLLLNITSNGTNAKPVNEIKEIKDIIDSGFTVADAAIPFTAPADVQNIKQLNLFD